MCIRLLVSSLRWDVVCMYICIYIYIYVCMEPPSRTRIEKIFCIPKFCLYVFHVTSHLPLCVRRKIRLRGGPFHVQPELCAENRCHATIRTRRDGATRDRTRLISVAFSRESFTYTSLWRDTPPVKIHRNDRLCILPTSSRLKILRSSLFSLLSSCLILCHIEWN